MKLLSTTQSAIALFIYVMFSNACVIGIVRHIAPEFHTFQIVFCFNIVALLCFVPWLLRGGRHDLKTAKFKLFSLRAILEFVSFSSSFYAITLIPMPMHTAILFITPIFGTIVAMVILREQGNWVTYLSVLVGFSGMLVITRPWMSPDAALIGVLFALAAALGFALCASTIKILTRSESTGRIAFYMVAMTTLIAAPFGLANWHTPQLHHLPWFIAIGLLAYSQQIAIAKALQGVPYITLIPLNFAQLVFVGIIAYIFYGEVVDSWTILGSVMIVAGTLFNAYYSSRIARQVLMQPEKA